MNTLKNMAEYITMLKTTHEAHVPVLLHRHDNALGGYDFELVYVISGRAINLVVGQEPREVGPGEYFFLDGGIEHTYSVVGDDDFKIINLIFDNRAVDLWYKKIETLAELAVFYGINPNTEDSLVRYDYYFKDDEVGSVFKLFSEIGTELSERLPGYYEAVRCRLMEILIKGLRQYFVKDSSNNYSSAVRYIIDYLNVFYMEGTTLSELAKKLNLTLPHLSKKFKDEVGQTYLEYLHARRISESCRILSTSDNTIENIAEFIGYSDSKKYREKFNALMGMSPREYRRRMRSQVQHSKQT